MSISPLSPIEPASSTSPGAVPAKRRRGRDLVVLIAALASVAIALRLGLWQLDRAAQKTALQHALGARFSLPPLDISALARSESGVEAQHFRRVVLHGHWVAGRTIFLDNRQMDDKPGFFVVTPLAIDGSAASVLVQRGWVARNFEHREALPDVPLPKGDVAVDGIVAPSPSRMYQLGEAGSGVIRQNLDTVAFERESGLALLPLSVQELSTAANGGDGLLRHWPAPASDVQKHYGYAFQWFAIGAGIAFLYVRHRFFRSRHRRPRA